MLSSTAPTSRAFTSRSERLAAWAACQRQPSDRQPSDRELDFNASSSMLRDLLRRGLVGMTDLRDDPQWFFEAHRVVAQHGEELGEGFWTRFTVQFNLFAGTVLAVGNASHIEQLRVMQEAGELGCFALTERFAGVSSGMIVETIATHDPETRTFVITSPNEGSKKNWISQGFVADRSVVVADLHVGGTSHGPHAFLIDFRVASGGSGEKQLVHGVRLADMGRKTVANDLDNAWIAFDDVRVPEAALLDRYAGIDAEGRYVRRGSPGDAAAADTHASASGGAGGAGGVGGAVVRGMHAMEMIGQRLFTGRVAVAQAALAFGRYLFAKTREYTDSKLCWAPKGTPAWS